MRAGESVHLVHLHRTGRYGAGPVAVSVTMPVTLNRSTGSVKGMIPAVRGRTLGRRLLLRRMMMTPRSRRPFAVNGNVVGDSGAVLVVPAIISRGERERRRAREGKGEGKGVLGNLADGCTRFVVGRANS